MAEGHAAGAPGDLRCHQGPEGTGRPEDHHTVSSDPRLQQPLGVTGAEVNACLDQLGQKWDEMAGLWSNQELEEDLSRFEIISGMSLSLQTSDLLFQRSRASYQREDSAGGSLLCQISSAVHLEIAVCCPGS